jgi:hypothetical protein
MWYLTIIDFAVASLSRELKRRISCYARSRLNQKANGANTMTIIRLNSTSSMSRYSLWALASYLSKSPPITSTRSIFMLIWKTRFRYRNIISWR